MKAASRAPCLQVEVSGIAGAVHQRQLPSGLIGLRTRELDDNDQTTRDTGAHVAGDGARRRLVRRPRCGQRQSEAKIDEYVLFGATTARASDTTTGWRLRGGYQFSRFFALEVAYVDFGDVDYHFDPDDCPSVRPGRARSMCARPSMDSSARFAEFCRSAITGSWMPARLRRDERRRQRNRRRGHQRQQ